MTSPKEPQPDDLAQQWWDVTRENTGFLGINTAPIQKTPPQKKKFK